MKKRFKKWLNFESPTALDADGWTEWEDRYRAEAPVRFWLTRKLPYLSYMPVKWKFDGMVSWVRYRIVRYHILDTGLKPGYYDSSHLMLCVNFTLLKDFVEIEKASMQAGWNGDKGWLATRTGLTKLLVKVNWYRRATFRSRELGIKYLSWEASLDDPHLPEGDRSSRQAESARELRELYLWWVDVYPNREEIPYPARSEHKNKSVLYTMSDAYKKEFPEEAAATSSWAKAHHAQEQEWEQEDDAMLKRLIIVRHSLWT